MGITFRSGDYVRFVRFGHRTIKDGEAAAVWNARGELTQVVGPRRITLWFSTIRFLYHRQATHGQYLQIQHRTNGTVEHVVGPVALFENPTYHSSIQVKDGYNLATQDECLVMYGGGSGSGGDKVASANRRIVYGPQFVIPSEQESVHTFTWSNASTDAPLSSSFEVLKTNQIQELWKLQLGLKTLQGPTVTALLAVSYKIECAEKTLEIADPIAYCLAAIRCDANRGNLDLANVSSAAGQISTYPAFGEAMTACGFGIVKLHVLELAFPKAVVDKRLQDKHESEQAQKAAAQLERELELGQLDLEKKRAEAEAQAELDKAQSRLDTEVAEQARAVRLAAVENELLLRKMRGQAQSDATKQANQAKLDYLRGLAEIGVDVTKVLCAQAEAGRPRKGASVGTPRFEAPAEEAKDSMDGFWSEE